MTRPQLNAWQDSVLSESWLRYYDLATKLTHEFTNNTDTDLPFEAILLCRLAIVEQLIMLNKALLST